MVINMEKLAKLIISVLVITGIMCLSSTAFTAHRVHTGAKPESRSLPVDSTMNGISTDKQKALIDSQIRNQNAQADYYRFQAKSTQNAPIGFWKKTLDNPAALGAILAALFAIISFVFNYSATRQIQRDTQFYEALKRFGDDSPAIRASAAGLLSQMAGDNSIRYRWYYRVMPWYRWKSPYACTAIDQLVNGLQLENNSVVLNSIKDAMESPIMAYPEHSIKRLHEANLALQEQMVLALADYFSLQHLQRREDILDQIWEEIAPTAGYECGILKVLVDRPDWKH